MWIAVALTVTHVVLERCVKSQVTALAMFAIRKFVLVSINNLFWPV
jgi:hypothetical protein